MHSLNFGVWLTAVTSGCACDPSILSSRGPTAHARKHTRTQARTQARMQARVHARTHARMHPRGVLRVRALARARRGFQQSHAMLRHWHGARALQSGNIISAPAAALGLLLLL